MADLIVSPVIDFVKQRLVAYLEDRIDLQSGAEGKLEKLETVLNRILPVANTAEEVDLEKHKDLKPWMWDLKVAVEEAKDELDEFEYLRLKRQAEGDGVDDEVHSFPSSSTSKRLKGIAGRMFNPSSLYNYAKKFIPSKNDSLERLRNIQCKLEELDSRAVQFLQLVMDRKATDREHQNQDVRKRETSSSVVERELVGRKDVLEDIITKLLEGEGEHICVISVVGQGGMGKTTVAQHVFNDTRVAAHFQVRMWTHVSQVFDISTLTKKIIESASRGERCTDTDSLETLQQKLTDVLKSKRFLLVLDDVWYGQNRLTMEEEWNKLCSPLTESGGKGSKILLTSRTWEVKELPGPLTTMISLEGLTQDECWSIIQTSAFRHSKNLDGCRDLVPIGRQISLKVQGSPLAAKAVGGMLRKELSWRHWSNILNTELSKLPGNNLMSVLRLSYQYLPPHLRQCFAYCSLFPKGHIFEVDMLVRMWVAHGYIRHPPYGEMTEEDMGKSYFDDLLSAGFFTLRIVGHSKTTVMHDLMNDLAQFVTTDEIFRIEEGTQYCPIPKMLRHLSVRTDYLAVLSKNRHNLSELESFILFPCRSRGVVDSVDLNGKLVKEVLQQLRRVRVLDLSWCKVKELPEDTSHWVHLRYLNMSMTQICRIPDSLSILYHLQVLIVPESFKCRPVEVRSPEKFNFLVNLRFLSTDTRLKLTCIRGAKSLQLVTNLHVEKGRGSAIFKKLKSLNDLRGLLSLNDLHYIESGAAAREAQLCRKNQLQMLYLKWGRDCSPDVAMEVLQGLQPHKCLERLYIHGYPGMMCPRWMSIPILENLTSVFLFNLFHLECLPSLGLLPLLQLLSLECLPRVRKLSQEGFPSLKFLKIERMEELEEWSGPDGSGGLPCLHELRITECPKMRMLPTLSHTVTQLHIEAVGISSLPGLIVNQGIAANNGSNIISFSSKLSTVGIRDCRNLTTLGGFLPDQQCLTHLYIEDCPNLTWAAPREYGVDHGLLPSSIEELAISHIDDNAMSRCLQANLTSLQALFISSCQALTPSALEVLHALPSLKVLRINNCPRLLIETSSISVAVDGPLALERLEIDDPLMLVKVPVLKSLTSVQEVHINDASRLISFSPDLGEWLLQNATSLRELTIEQEGWHLQSLPKLPDSIKKFWNVDQQFITRDEYKIREIKYTKIS